MTDTFVAPTRRQTDEHQGNWGRRNIRPPAQTLTSTMLSAQGGMSILDTYQQKQLAKGNQAFKKWSGIIVKPDSMASFHYPGRMSKAET